MTFDTVFIRTIQTTFNETHEQAADTYMIIVSGISQQAIVAIQHEFVDLEASFALAWNMENFASKRIPRHRSARFCHFHRLLTLFMTVQLYQCHCLQMYGHPSPFRILNTARDRLIGTYIQDLYQIFNDVDTYIREHTDADVDFNHVLNDMELDPRELPPLIDGEDEYEEGYTSGSDSDGF